MPDPTSAPGTPAPWTTNPPLTPAPTSAPTPSPTSPPTSAPTTGSPTSAPTTGSPTTGSPTTGSPTSAPTTGSPTSAPTTGSPTTGSPTTPAPACEGTNCPTQAPTPAPECTHCPHTPSPTGAPTSCKRSTRWSAKRKIESLYAVVTSISAKTSHKIKCVSKSLPEHSWITNPPKTICSRTVKSTPEQSWSGLSMGSNLIDGFVVSHPFNNMYLLDDSTGSWENQAAYSMLSGGSLNTSQITNMQVISDNAECLNSDGSACSRTIFSKTDNFQVKGWSLDDYKQVTNGYEIYSYLIDIKLTWEARAKAFETELSLSNVNHDVLERNKNVLTFASSPNTDNTANLNLIVDSIKNMPYFMVALISSKK